MRTAILTGIDARLRAAGIEIPFPQRDLHLRTVDEPAREALGEIAAAQPDEHGRVWPPAAGSGSGSGGAG